jgi:tetratricopeptide (TPR) repeat protein
MQSAAVSLNLLLFFAFIGSLPAKSQGPVAPPTLQVSVQAGRQARNEAMETRYKQRLEVLQNSAEPFSIDTRAEIAMVLRRLASIYRETGRMKEAEEALQKLLEIYSELARFQPESYQREVSSALVNLGGIYRDSGRIEEATGSYEEALAMLREIGDNASEEGKADLALTLHNLANLYRYANRMGEAEQGYQEAIALRRELTAENPEMYKLDLASSLNSLGNLYSETNRMLDAERVYKESVSLRQEILKTEAYITLDEPKAGLALTLGNLARTQIMTGRMEEAEAGLTQALAIYRELAESDRDEYLPGLASSLDHFVMFLFQSRQFNRAIEPSWELVSLWRELVHQNPVKFRADFIGSLTRSASLLGVAGRKGDVAGVVAEAVALGRDMWEENPEQHAKIYAEILITSAIVSNSPDDPTFCRNLREAFEVANNNDIKQCVQKLLSQCGEAARPEQRF